jgi:hypothetical protein
VPILRGATWVSTGAACLASDPDARQALARSSAEVHAAGLLPREAAIRGDQDVVDATTVAENRREAAVAAQLCVSAVDRLFAPRPRGGRLRADRPPDALKDPFGTVAVS